ncbi:hypothetical protein WG219_11275 [Ectopseudomonas mendocina]|uniref:Replication protein P n=1 Tax=Ectopseudomonas mendocina TaxID=300 RepID=A0ABZ2RC69_ECTME
MSADQSHAWASALAGLSGQQIAVGLSVLTQRGDDWPPSAPEFRKLCSPSAYSMGLPSIDRAYRQACEIAYPGADSSRIHPAVYHAACEAGFYELRMLPESKSRPLFERAYEVTVRMCANGEPLREVPKALPEKVSVVTPEVGVSALQEMRAALRGKA